MQKDWASLACPSSNGLTFWSHEWDKHGTCSESVLNQHSYFSSALNLKDQVNLLRALKSAGKYIYPPNMILLNFIIGTVLLLIKNCDRNSTKWAILQLREY